MKKFYFLSTTLIALMLLTFNVQLVAQGPSISLIQPDAAGIQWTIGNSYLISWTDNLQSTVDIDYSSDNGANYTSIVTGVSGSTYNWNTTGLSASATYLIRVKSTNAPTTYYDVSSNNFALVAYSPNGTIHVDQPNLAGIQWQRGTTHLISWTDDLIEPVKIEYQKGAAAAVEIVASATGSTYGWDIPAGLATGTDYKIIVSSSAAGSSVTDASDNDFEIIATATGGSITIIQPNGGESWFIGNTFLISWSDNITENVDIELWKTGAFLSTIASDVSGSSYAWNTATLTAGTDYKVKIKSVTQPTVAFDFSDADFELTDVPATGTITVIQPNGGEIWLEGNTYLISWIDNISEPVEVEVYNGTAWSTLAASVTGSTYDWNTTGYALSTAYKVRVSSTDPNSLTTPDESDAAFTLTDTPQGGTTITVVQPSLAGIQWQRGTTHLISWIDDVVEPVKIEYQKGAAGPVTIAASVVGTTYNWAIPAGLTAGTDYKIIVTSTVTGAITDDSDNAFEITENAPGGTLTVIQPNGGESWFVGNSYIISWTDNISEPVDIELWKGGVQQPNIASSISGSTYTWNTTALAAGTDYIVKIVSTTQTSVNDVSDAVFELTTTPPAGIITIVQPNGGETMLIGNSYLISWIDNISEPVKIEYDDGLGAGYLTLPGAASVVGSTFSWNTTGFAASALYKIKISSTNVASSTPPDESDAVFELTDNLPGSIEVVQPNGGEVWLIGNSYLISWTDNITENVNIKLWNGTTYSTIASGVSGSTYTWSTTGLSAGTTYKIRVESSVYPSTVYDESDAVFELTTTLPGDIEVIQPNGGELWLIGNTYLISWTDNISEDVDITYTTDGVNYTTIATGVSGTTYSWNTTAMLAGTNYKIRVESVVYPTTVFDESDAVFELTATMPGTITVVQPNGGETWLIGNTYLITWTDNITEPVDIELWKNGVLQVPNIASGVSGSTYSWNTTGLVAGTDYKVKIKSTVYPTTVSDMSNADFELTTTLPGQITVIQPNGGESWIIGQTYLIDWTDNITEPVDIELWNTAGKVSDIATGVSGGVSDYAWNTTGITAATDYRVKILSTVYPTTVNDISDATFSLSATPGGTITVLQPNGGEAWLIGNTYLISWNDNITENVNIKYTTDGGANYTTIASGVAGTTYNWLTTGAPSSTNYKIRVESVSNPTTVYDESNAVFELSTTPSGTVTVAQPNGGEQWLIGNTYLISWSKNFSENVNIRLRNSAGAYADIALNVSGNSYVWTAAGAAATDYRVRIESVSNAAVYDDSNADFSLVTSLGGSVTVIQPNGGEIWMANTVHLLSWTDDLAETVDIELWENGSWDSDIATGVAGTTYTWTIPNGQTASSLYKVRVVSSTDVTIEDFSDASFEITPYVMMSAYPNPSNQSFTINMAGSAAGNYVVQMYNRFNSQILETTMDPEVAETMTISTQSLPNGIYFLTLTSNDTRISTKIVVQHR